MAILNIEARRVGGLRFLRVGRLTLSLSLSRAFRPLGSVERTPKARRYTARQIERACERAYNAGLLTAARRMAR